MGLMGLHLDIVSVQCVRIPYGIALILFTNNVYGPHLLKVLFQLGLVKR